MAYENSGSGVLYKNLKKEKDSQPDYRGSMEVNGNEHWISAWIKEGKDGKYMSLAFSPKQQQAEQQAPPQEDDGIPF